MLKSCDTFWVTCFLDFVASLQTKFTWAKSRSKLNCKIAKGYFLNVIGSNSVCKRLEMTLE